MSVRENVLVEEGQREGGRDLEDVLIELENRP